MTTYLLGRLGQVVPTILLVSVVVFLMLHLVPGDPVMVILGTRQIAFTEEDVARLREDMGLDQPLPVQYMTWVGNALRGDLGESYFQRREIAPLLMERLGATVQLALGALLFAVPVGIGAGILSSLLRGTVWDRLISAIVVAGVAVPVFALGLFLIVIFGAELRWLPVSGMTSIGEGGLGDRLQHLILPAVSLGVGPAAILARLTRSAMLDVLNEDYIRTARAKGLAEQAVILRHAFRGVLVPVVTVLGLQVGFLLGGAVLVEVVFSWPGMGQLIIDGILRRDFPIVQGAVLVVALTYVLVNLVVDVLYAMIDPRIRYGA
ncbi:MAG: ABC transporter permease [Chloroflexota bacterium]|nr:ABC transporter permease [Chloroflexota bacterium]